MTPPPPARSPPLRRLRYRRAPHHGRSSSRGSNPLRPSTTPAEARVVRRWYRPPCGFSRFPDPRGSCAPRSVPAKDGPAAVASSTCSTVTSRPCRGSFKTKEISTSTRGSRKFAVSISGSVVEEHVVQQRSIVRLVDVHGALHGPGGEPDLAPANPGAASQLHFNPGRPARRARRSCPCRDSQT